VAGERLFVIRSPADLHRKDQLLHRSKLPLALLAVEHRRPASNHQLLLFMRVFLHSSSSLSELVTAHQSRFLRVAQYPSWPTSAPAKNPRLPLTRSSRLISRPASLIQLIWRSPHLLTALRFQLKLRANYHLQKARHFQSHKSCRYRLLVEILLPMS